MELIVPFLAAIALCAGAALLLMRLWQGRRSGVSIRMQVFVTMAAVSGGFAALLGLIAVERLEHRSLRLAEEVAGEDAALVAYLLSAALSDRESRCGSAAVDPRSLDTIANSLTEPSLGALRPGLLRLELRDPQGRLVFQSVPPRLSHSRRREAFAEGKAPLLVRGQPVGEVRITRASLGVTQILKEVASRAAVLSLLLVIGTVTGTSPTLDLKLQDADDNSGTNAADVSFGGFPQVTVGTTTYQIVVDVKKLRPYLRVVGTIGGTTPNITAGVFLIARPKSF